MTTAPVPGPPAPLDPAAVRADVEAVLAARAPGEAQDLATLASELDGLHQRLSAALATVDRV